MKLKVIKSAAVETSPIRRTLHRENGIAELTVGQSIKQSLNYQSAEANYTVKLCVPDDDTSINKGFARANKIVEDQLTAKYIEQKKLLNTLT